MHRHRSYDPRLRSGARTADGGTARRVGDPAEADIVAAAGGHAEPTFPQRPRRLWRPADRARRAPRQRHGSAVRLQSGCGEPPRRQRPSPAHPRISDSRRTRPYRHAGRSRLAASTEGVGARRAGVSLRTRGCGARSSEAEHGQGARLEHPGDPLVDVREGARATGRFGPPVPQSLNRSARCRTRLSTVSAANFGRGPFCARRTGLSTACAANFG